MVATTRRVRSPVLALLLLLPLLAVWPSTPADAADFDNAERIDAANYTTTGIAVSKRVFPNGADAAVLTRDDHFPDALAASALAASVNGPVLFTDTDQLTGSTATELNRVLDPGDTVYITGGTAAVSEGVANEVRDQGYAVNRLSGKTRVETAAAIARAVGVPGSGRVLIARAFGPPGRDITTGWVDSVTCGAYANRTTTPVLLTGTGGLDAPTAAALDDLGATDATICGGEAAVPAQAAEDLRAAGLDVDRVFGATRVETAVAVAEQLFDYSSAAGHSYLLVNGYGDNFGWGLAATPLAGSLGAPILLVGSDFPTDCADETQPARNTLCHLETVGGGKADVIAVGRTAQVGDAVLDAAAEAAGGDKARTSNPSGPVAAPTGVSATNVSTPSEGRVQVTWDAVDGDVAGYNVYYGTDSPDKRAGPSRPTMGPNTTSFTVGALQLDSSYEFAVTTVADDGQESSKSRATATTTAPSVNLASPTAKSPARIEPSSELTLDIDYTASEGATFRLFYRRPSDGGDWSEFVETAGSPGRMKAGSSSVSPSVTAPETEAIYDLKVRLTPKGSEPVIDFELGSLDVRVPRVTVNAPTDTAAVTAGQPFTVRFTSTVDASRYTVARRMADQDPEASWIDYQDVHSSDGDGVVRAHEQEIVEVTVPDDEGGGTYDLRVTVVGGDGDDLTGSREAAVAVSEPPGDKIEMDAPTSDNQADIAYDPEPQTFPIEFTYTTEAGDRDYELSWWSTDDGQWKVFETGSAPVGTDMTQIVDVQAPSPGPLDEEYDLRVRLLDADGEQTISDTQTSALVVRGSGEPFVDIVSPTEDDPATVEPTGTYTLEFDYGNLDQVEVNTFVWLAEYRLDEDPTEEGWMPWTDDGFPDFGLILSSDDDFPHGSTTRTGTASPDVPGTYDLRVTISAVDNSGETASGETPSVETVAVDVQSGAIVVES